MAETKKNIKKSINKSTKKNNKKVTKSENNIKNVKEVSTTKDQNKKENISTQKIENKRLFIILDVAVLIGILIGVLAIFGKIESSKIIDKVNEALSSDTPQVIYVTKDDCTYCELNATNMDSIKNDYDVQYLNVDISKLTSADFAILSTLLNVDDTSFNTPYLAVVQNNEVKDTLDGIKSYNLLFEFLQNNGIISNDAKLYLNYINYTQYKDLISSSENQIIILASSTCHYCLSEHPILIQIAKDKGVKINYMNLDYAFSSEDEYNEFKTSLSWFNTNTGWGTPTTLIVKNNDVVSSLIGYQTYDKIVSFYSENGMIK